MVSAHAIATLIFSLLSIFCTIHPIPIPTPQPLPKISLNLTAVSIISILILWAAQCLNPTVIRNGIVGTDGIKPYNIVILFFSLSYMAITLDTSNVLQAAAYRVTNKGGNNGWKLYLYFYVLLTVASILLGHDPVILSGTMFLDHYTQVAGLGPLAWVTAEFAAANTASMVLFVGNPTNVVVCEGFGINNAIFTAYTILPFVACNIFISCFVAMTSQYYRQAPLASTPTTPRDSQEASWDRVAACVGGFMLVTTLVLCLVLSFFGIDAWMISLPFAICKFLFDCGWDFCRPRPDTLIEPTGSEEETGEESHRDSAPGGVEHSGPVSSINRGIESEPGPSDATPGTSTAGPGTSTAEEAQPSRRHNSQNSDKDDHKIQVPKMESPTSSNDPAPEEAPGNDTERAQTSTHSVNSQRTDRETTSRSDLGLQAWLLKRFPTVMTALPRLPFGFVPFAFSQFILVEALNYQGWVDTFGDWLARASDKQVHPTIWLIGVLGVILCNISGTRIGATIFLTRVIRAAALPYDVNRAAAIALAIASNVGAVNFTFSASLARLLWRSVRNRTSEEQRAFAFWNLSPIFVLTTVGLGVVSAEMAVLFSL